MEDKKYSFKTKSIDDMFNVCEEASQCSSSTNTINGGNNYSEDIHMIKYNDPFTLKHQQKIALAVSPSPVGLANYISSR